jgi:hypothetical protein
MASSSYVNKVRLSERSNGDYVLVVIMSDGQFKMVNYYTITATTVTLRQQLGNNFDSQLTMTRNTKFVAHQFATTAIAFYEYNQATDRYIRTKIITQFATSISNIYVSENASMLFGAFNSR